MVYDNAENKIEITTSGGRSIILSDKDKKITYKTSQVTIEVEDTKYVMESGTDINFKAGANMKLEASSNLSLKAANIDITASGTVNVKGGMVNINS